MSANPATGRYHHGDLKNALLLTAERLLAEQGPVALNLRTVARVAGVSHAAPYRHFSDKAALLRALALFGFARLEQAVTAAGIRTLQDCEHQLIETGVVYVRFAHDHPGMLRMMSGGLSGADGDPEVRRAAGAVPRLLTHIIERGRAQDVFRGRDTAELVTLVWSTIHGLALLGTGGGLPEMFGDRYTVTEYVRAVLQNLIFGIAK